MPVLRQTGNYIDNKIKKATFSIFPGELFYARKNYIYKRLESLGHKELFEGYRFLNLKNISVNSEFFLNAFPG